MQVNTEQIKAMLRTFVNGMPLNDEPIEWCECKDEDTDPYFIPAGEDKQIEGDCIRCRNCGGLIQIL